ncbi:MAG TPA: helix-turn-helix domain-containing protein [Steroidobacteraceae bacterium]|nr:helix-turn-helix domain-containing protein [Steroidobacteraceae bacterium]
MTETPAKPIVAILALPHATGSVVYGLYDLFVSAGRDWDLLIRGEPGTAVMQPVIAARRVGPLSVTNGVRIDPTVALEDCAPDIVCVPEVSVRPDQPIDGLFDAEIEWLRRCHASGAVLASVCSGALLLAESGLLDGEDATTHWAFCDVLRRRYPKVRVLPDRTLVTSGEGHRLVMAGGGASWLDLGLYLIARVSTVEIAMQTGRVNLIEWHATGQQPYACISRTRQSSDVVIADCQTWLANNYEVPSPVAEMARRSGMAERSFTRRFRKATGLSPLEYVHTLRLEEAKQMLEAGSEPVEAIANAVGYQDPAFFGRLFKRKVGLTPAQYRRRFGAMRRMLTARIGPSSGE